MEVKDGRSRKKVARRLRRLSFKFREIGEMLGVSRQRAHQLANSSDASGVRGRPRNS